MLHSVAKISLLTLRTASSATTSASTSLLRPLPLQYQSIRYFAAAKPDKKDDVAKVKTKKGPTKAAGKKKGGRGDTSRADAIYKFIHASEDAKKIKLDFTEEELKRNKEIAREFQRQCAIYNAEFHKDLALKARLIQDALKAMPPTLREQAKIIDGSIPPQDRPWPRFETPPIKGFNALDYVDKKKK
eukprot:Colp12_sorted_trinity150504_noHs@18523